MEQETCIRSKMLFYTDTGHLQLRKYPITLENGQMTFVNILDSFTSGICMLVAAWEDYERHTLLETWPT